METNQKSGLHVVVGIDFSEGSELSVERALRLPYGSGGSLTLLHVAAEGRREMLEGDLEEWKRETVDEMTGVATERAGSLGVAVKIRGEVRFGDPARTLTAAAEELNASLLVVGRHGESALGELLIGSTAERIVRSSPVPVLVVQTDASGGYRRVLVGAALDGSEIDAFEAASRLLEPDVRKVELLHAIRLPAPSTVLPLADTPQPRPLEALRELEQHAATESMAAAVETFRSLGYSAEGEIVISDPRTALLKASRERDVDLLVLATHQRRRLSRLLAGSVAEGVARHAECDVLVAPPAVVE
jgi:universal stress protein E